MGDLEIRQASADDLSALASALGQERYFADRIHRQEAGRGVLLVARLAGVPVGDVYLWYEQAEEPEIALHLPHVPLLNHLEVRPDRQNRGIGTSLIAAAEKRVHEDGFDRIAMGVDPHNTGAIRLYERLGYRRWPYPDVDTTYEVFLDTGERRRYPETCRVYTRDLA